MAVSSVHTAFKSIAVANMTVATTAANTLVAADESKRYKIVDCYLRAVGGDAVNGTLVTICAGAEVALSVAVAPVDDGVIVGIKHASATCTHLGHWSEGGTAIAIKMTGVTMTGPTTVDCCVSYLVEGAN